MAEMDRVVGAMQQQLTHIEKTLRDHGRQLGELRDMLRDQANKPPKRALDLNKLTPKIISVVIIGAAAALQLLPTQVAIKLISSLL
jgi:hypothetical protein